MAKNEEQFYLLKLMEECAEVAQVASKASQFGGRECRPGQPLSNFDRVHAELDDVMAMIQELNERYNFGYVPDPVAIAAKKVKVRRYLDYSISLGLVDAESVSGKTNHPRDDA